MKADERKEEERCKRKMGEKVWWKGQRKEEVKCRNQRGSSVASTECQTARGWNSLLEQTPPEVSSEAKRKVESKAAPSRVNSERKTESPLSYLNTAIT